MPNIEGVGTAKQADVAREADTLTKLDTFNIASINVIVLSDMVFQSSSFIVFFSSGSVSVVAFPYLKSFSNGSRFPEYRFTFHNKPSLCSIVKVTCIFEESKAFDNSVRIFC